MPPKQSHEKLKFFATMLNIFQLKPILVLLATTIFLTLSIGCKYEKGNDDVIIPPPPGDEPVLTIYEKMAGDYVGTWMRTKYITTSSGTSQETTITNSTVSVRFNEDSTDLIPSILPSGLSWFRDTAITKSYVYYCTFNANDGTNAWFYFDADSLVWDTWNSHASAGPETSAFFTGKKQ